MPQVPWALLPQSQTAWWPPCENPLYICDKSTCDNPLWEPPPVHMWQPPVKTGRHGWHWFYYVGIHQIRHGTEKISANIVKIYYIIILSDITESVLDMHSCYCGAPCGSYESVSLKYCQSLSACLLFQHHIKIAFTAPRAKSNPPSPEWNVNPSRYGQPAEWEVWL